jgi:hypothetical protein
MGKSHTAHQYEEKRQNEVLRHGRKLNRENTDFYFSFTCFKWDTKTIEIALLLFNNFLHAVLFSSTTFAQSFYNETNIHSTGFYVRFFLWVNGAVSRLS